MSKYKKGENIVYIFIGMIICGAAMFLHALIDISKD